MKTRIPIVFFCLLVTSTFAIKHPTTFTSIIRCIQEKCPIVFLLEESGSKQFVLSLENGIAVGEGGIVTSDGKILTDTETYKCDQQRLFHPTRDITTENQVFFDGTLAVVSSPGQQCYYHWILQVLPRLKILSESKINYDKIYFFSDNIKHKWQKESLGAVMDYLGISPDKILLVEEGTVVQAKKLLVPSVPWMPSKSSYAPLNWYKQFFKDVFIKQSTIETSKRVFISRSQANNRRISNEVDLVKELSKQGFVSYHLEDLSLYDQAKLFNNAEIIIGPHGSGWTNLIFCNPGTQVIEIDHGVKGKNQRSYFSELASDMGCTYSPFYVDLLEDTESSEDALAPINQDLTVDISAFEKFYQRLGTTI